MEDSFIRAGGLALAVTLGDDHTEGLGPPAESSTNWGKSTRNGMLRLLQEHRGRLSKSRTIMPRIRQAPAESSSTVGMRRRTRSICSRELFRW